MTYTVSSGTLNSTIPYQPISHPPLSMPRYALGFSFPSITPPFWSDLKNNFTEFFYVGQEKMKWISGTKKFRVWGSLGYSMWRGKCDIWGSSYLVGYFLRPLKGTPSECTFPLVPLVCSKAFPCRLCDTGNSAIFGSSSALVRNVLNFSRYQNPLATHLRVCHRNHADPLYIMGGVTVHFSAFPMPGYALESSFPA